MWFRASINSLLTRSQRLPKRSADRRHHDTVSLSTVSGKWVYVNFATANGTATTADNDYVATSGYVSFAPGQTTATITVVVRGDKRKEPNETFFVNLTGATDVTISDNQGVGTIVTDDGGTGSGQRNSTQKHK